MCCWRLFVADIPVSMVFVGLVAAVSLLCACGPSAADGSRGVLFEAAVTVDLGQDIGQNFGSLFEVQDESGRVVIGAGFSGVYNTRFRNDRYSLQYYVRPGQDADRLTVEPIGKPDADTGGAYMFDLDGQVYAWGHRGGVPYRRWDTRSGIWQDGEISGAESVGSGDGAMWVGDGLLIFSRSGVTYKGRQILAPPEEGRYYCFYYANGHLVFYYTRPGTEPEGRTALYACPWTPDRQDPIDLAEAKTLTLTYSGETPFAFGQLRQDTVTCSNMGGFYVFDGKAWKVLLEPDNRTSYQIYTIVNYYDRMLMGQYPTGNLIEYDGYRLIHLADQPPVMEGVSGSAREAQTSMIYRGELYVGVWPWAEVWRYDADEHDWRFVQRMFTQPPLTDEFTHPYEEDIRAFNEGREEKMVANNWGQRVTSMVPRGTDMILSTSAKGTFQREERLSFLTDEVFAEYGQAHRMTLPGNLAATISPVSGPTHLRLVLRRDRMQIYRDGRLLAEARIAPELVADLQPATITWRYGVFGPFQGSLTNRTVRPALEAVRPQRGD